MTNKEDIKHIEARLQAKSNPTKPAGKSKRSGCKKFIYTGVFTLIILIVILIALAILAPTLFLIVINVLWIILLAVVVTFFLLGVLVMLGLKKQASEMLNILLEGSLTIIDLADFAKEVYRTFLRYLRELVLFITPIASLVTAFVVYVLLMYLFKWYGQDHDMTLFTALITLVLVFVTGFLNRPKKAKPGKKSWIAQVREKFVHSFKDGLEIVIFVFFLTIDSTNLFFLPPELNVELHAMVGEYNLMTPSFTIDRHMQITITIIMIAILIEIVRNMLRMTISAVRNYQFATDILEKRNKQFKTAQVTKLAVRQSVRTSMDEILKFITFTTIIISVFLIFPRLKLVTIAVASGGSLLLDFIIRSRLIAEKGDDLISRIIVKIFRL